VDYCDVYLGVFGLWDWECIDADGEVICESRQVFDSYEECVEDARLHVRLEVSLPKMPLAA
jgi:hypothetical protein